MMDSVVITQPEHCTGCTACQAICPVACIEMKEDAEGFARPVIGDACIRCLYCQKVCPANHYPDLSDQYIPQQAYAAVHKDMDIWRDSASGGAFTGICQAWADDDRTVIYGVVSEGKEVLHQRMEGLSGLSAMRRSKYVQSTIEGIFQQIKEDLITGRKVLFSGVPCQVAGLRNYLNKTNTDNLLCVDLICHGVGSPGLFRQYLSKLETIHSSKLISYEFRRKRMSFGIQRIHNTKIYFENGLCISNEKDLYSRTFLNKTMCRRSCYDCGYSNLCRMGDITIADFKNLFVIFPRMRANINASTYIVNTKKGENVTRKVENKIQLYPCRIQDIVRFNKPLTQVTGDLIKRNAFFDALGGNDDIIGVMKHFLSPPSMIRKMLKIVPLKIRERAKVFLRRD